MTVGFDVSVKPSSLTLSDSLKWFTHVIRALFSLLIKEFHLNGAFNDFEGLLSLFRASTSSGQ